MMGFRFSKYAVFAFLFIISFTVKADDPQPRKLTEWEIRKNSQINPLPPIDPRGDLFYRTQLEAFSLDKDKPQNAMKIPAVYHTLTEFVKEYDKWRDNYKKTWIDTGRKSFTGTTESPANERHLSEWSRTASMKADKAAEEYLSYNKNHKTELLPFITKITDSAIGLSSGKGKDLGTAVGMTEMIAKGAEGIFIDEAKNIGFSGNEKDLLKNIQGANKRTIEKIDALMKSRPDLAPYMRQIQEGTLYKWAGSSPYESPESSVKGLRLKNGELLKKLEADLLKTQDPKEQKEFKSEIENLKIQIKVMHAVESKDSAGIKKAVEGLQELIKKQNEETEKQIQEEKDKAARDQHRQELKQFYGSTRRLNSEISAFGSAIGSPEISKASSVLNIATDIAEARNIIKDLKDFQNDFSSLATFSGAFDATSLALGAVTKLVGLLSGGGGKDINQIIYEQIVDLRKDVQKMREEMHDHFNQIHEEIYSTYMSTMDRLQAIHNDIKNQSSNTIDIQNRLATLKSDLDRGTKHLSTIGKELLTDPLRSQVKKCLNKDPYDAKPTSEEDIDKCYDGLLHCALEQAQLVTARGTGATPRSIQEILDARYLEEKQKENLFSKPTNLSEQVKYLDALDESLKVKQGISSDSTNTVKLAPDLWASCTKDFVTLIYVYPEHFKKRFPNGMPILDPASGMGQIRAIGESFKKSLQDKALGENSLLLNLFNHYAAQTLLSNNAVPKVLDQDMQNFIKPSLNPATLVGTTNKNWNDYAPQILSNYKRDKAETHKKDDQEKKVGSLSIPACEGFHLGGDPDKGKTSKYRLPINAEFYSQLAEHFPSYVIAENYGLGAIELCYADAFFTDLIKDKEINSSHWFSQPVRDKSIELVVSGRPTVRLTAKFVPSEKGKALNPGQTSESYPMFDRLVSDHQYVAFASRLGTKITDPIGRPIRIDWTAEHRIKNGNYSDGGKDHNSMDEISDHPRIWDALYNNGRWLSTMAPQLWPDGPGQVEVSLLPPAKEKFIPKENEFEMHNESANYPHPYALTKENKERFAEYRKGFEQDFLQPALLNIQEGAFGKLITDSKQEDLHSYTPELTAEITPRDRFRHTDASRNLLNDTLGAVFPVGVEKDPAIVSLKSSKANLPNFNRILELSLRQARGELTFLSFPGEKLAEFERMIKEEKTTSPDFEKYLKEWGLFYSNDFVSNNGKAMKVDFRKLREALEAKKTEMKELQQILDRVTSLEREPKKVLKFMKQAASQAGQIAFPNDKVKAAQIEQEIRAKAEKILVRLSEKLERWQKEKDENSVTPLGDKSKIALTGDETLWLRLLGGYATTHFELAHRTSPESQLEIDRYLHALILLNDKQEDIFGLPKGTVPRAIPASKEEITAEIIPVHSKKEESGVENNPAHSKVGENKQENNQAHSK